MISKPKPFLCLAFLGLLALCGCAAEIPLPPAPMVEVPAGEFVMGSDPAVARHSELEWGTYIPASDLRYMTYWPPPYESEMPRLTVSLPAFAIDKLQVTNVYYRRCVAAGACSPLGGERESLPATYFSLSAYDNYPASVFWQQAVTYCTWQGKRLPTEAEWEKAARGTDERRWPWGNTWDESRVAMQVEPVGRHPAGASPYGAFDMVGDLPEWTLDTFQHYPGNVLPVQKSFTGWYAASKAVRGGVLRPGFQGVDSTTTVRQPYETAEEAAGFRCVQAAAPAALAQVVVRAEPMVITPTAQSPVDLAGMIEVPAGEFIMGAPDDWVDKYGKDHPAEKPQHRVYLDAFYIDKYETTNAEYAAFLNVMGGNQFACAEATCAAVLHEKDTGGYMGDSSRLIERPGQLNTYGVKAGYERHPVDDVSWNGARAYCAWRGKRLPTEAEWEKAARGTDGRRWPWGNEWDSRTLVITHMPMVNEVGRDPLDVSPYGVADVLGNAMEWVGDWADADYYTVSPYRNPQGPSGPHGDHPSRVVRSTPGSAYWGITHRNAYPPDRLYTWWYYWAGVRCAYSVPQP
jgi:formylglycine-generating enzyme required for sulfatase activity